ncbi:MAG: 4a-hydroxytetrahydrobiopterin dehydratase [Acidimicrobiia bacterium]|nr:4a-hydroxytetrahydrobiopterin dehydratase [Acidimicrobiia bacterium]
MEHIAVSAAEFAELEEMDDWRWVLVALRAEFRASTFTDAADLVATIGRAADAADHHPDVDLRYLGRVRVALTTHAAGTVTTLDVALAREISALAAGAGATSVPFDAQALGIAIDTTDADRIRPFWAAVLGYRDDDGILVDPRGSGPPVWFQPTDESRTERNRFHIDVSVPHDLADERVANALAAGGTLVTDRHARAWWILADADGNEACVCTWQDR